MYRIKNIKTGLYYQPIKSGCNLSPKGKVYQTKTNILNMGFSTKINLSVNKKNRVYPIIEQAYLKDWKDWRGKSLDEYNYEQINFYAPKDDFVIEKI